MPSRNVLFGVNQELRRQAQGLVTCIRIDGLLTEQVHHLTKGSWSQLRRLDLTNRFLSFSSAPQLSNSSAAQLSNEVRPVFSVTNASGYTYDTLFDPRENVFPQFQGKWPLLERLTVTLFRMDIAQVTALAEIDWPRLQTLCIEPEDDAIPALMMGNWPQLKDLSIENLGNTAFKHLSSLPWSTLQRLQLTVGQASPSGMYSLIQAHLPQLHELSFVDVLWYTDGEGEDSGEDCFAMLAQAKWPLLSKLELIGVDASHEGIRHLVTGQWPMLQTVTLEDSDITDRDVPLFVQAHWPNVQNLTLVGHGYLEHMEVLDICMHKWPAMQTLKLRIDTDQANNVGMSNMARDRWPSLDLQLISHIDLLQ